MKVMITGHKGFIGSHMTEHLSKEFEIIGFDIKDSIMHDVRNSQLVDSFISEHKPEVIIHLAANPDIPTSVRNPQEDLLLNVGGTINVLEACKDNDVKLFMFASTAQVYGEPKQRKMDENHPLNPKSPYAIGKLASENYIDWYNRHYGLRTLVFRFFNVYGEGQLPWAVTPAITRRMTETESDEFKMYGSKEDSRDFIYVKDICRAFEKAIKKDVSGEIINLASGKETFILALAKTIASVLGKEFKYVYSDKKDNAKITRMEADINKAKKMLCWETKYSLEEGVSRVVKREVEE